MTKKRSTEKTEPTAAPQPEADKLLGEGVLHLQQLLGIVQAAVANGQTLTGQMLRESAGVVRAIATAAGEQRQARKFAASLLDKVGRAEVLDYFRRLTKSDREQLLRDLAHIQKQSERSVLG